MQNVSQLSLDIMPQNNLQTLDYLLSFCAAHSLHRFSGLTSCKHLNTDTGLQW